MRHALDAAAWVRESPSGSFGSGGDVEALEPPGPRCICSDLHDPGCGRDGRTYGNPCQAYCTGWVAVAHPGPCGSP